jgi:ketopantoate reductase
LARTEQLRKKIMDAAKKTEKEELQKLLKDVEFSKRSKIDNITGYVLYERPSIASSAKEDKRD